MSGRPQDGGARPAASLGAGPPLRCPVRLTERPVQGARHLPPSQLPLEVAGPDALHSFILLQGRQTQS